ncbi:GNAT family N-acetyltransferase [Sphingorhabdus lutea]|uniref:GNAT family N-acetyltransferase n=1 Tax=Sphingorhabdus lutea TaxID=1913578 RepID=A0A1L3JCP1_9SPHN|nr:GNAT family protein [Sphingorhabdus lutea]APG62905.1 GNAT family N-acetyltransferase [Sphingorhabdus lutea]
MSVLEKNLTDRDLSLELFADHHVEGLRAAVHEDDDIWQIYPVNLRDEDAERQLKSFHGEDGWVRFIIVYQGKIVGTTSYIHPDLENGTFMIGGTYIEPSVRGKGINDRMKKLMLDHAFANGFWRAEFTVDTRNKRSMAAVTKLGGTLEGILRKNRVTWTGFVRDTALYSILKDEWENNA